ncbi:MAG: PDZ domain-containing protein [Acholeplasmatales bacterium]|nr:MAG: PDZ domain-containing protein [Acholeplasmatales bacterium]
MENNTHTPAKPDSVQDGPVKKPSSLKSGIYAGAFLLVLVAVFITGLMMTPPVRRYGNSAFNEVFDYLLNNHYTEPDAQVLWQGAINGMIGNLDDPFTRYFDEAEFTRYRQGFGESFVGIGVTVENIEEQVVIQTVWPDSPAEQGGLQAGDIITHVDGVDYANRSFAQTTSVLLGEINTTVEVGFKRAGIAETIFVSLTRAIIKNPSVVTRAYEVDGYLIGHLRIHTFGDETQNLVQRAVDDFAADDIDGLVIDLRDNGGGNLTTLVDVLDIFLSSETSTLPLFTLQTLENGRWKDTVYRPNNDQSQPYPITVLVNGQSASASEVFAAAMAEYGGYTIVGETTFGKGTLQSSIRMQSIRGDRLNLTIGIWLTPEGNWVHFDGGSEGFAPDVVVPQNPAFTMPLIFLREGEVYAFDQVSPRIAMAQQILNTVTDKVVRTDGYFDALTETALRDFRLGLGFSGIGILDAETAVALSDAMRTYRADVSNDAQLTEAINQLIEALAT